MKKSKFKIGAIIFIAGFLGILSLLALDLTSIKFIAENLPENVSANKLKFATLLNPTILLIVFTLIGTFLYDKAGYRLPIIDRFVFGDFNVNTSKIVFSGLIGGVLAGVSIVASMAVGSQFLPPEFLNLAKEFEPPLITRFLYGGITEEILMRFGFQTLLTWILFKGIKLNINSSAISAIIIASVFFGLGHLPILYLLVPNPSTLTIFFIIGANSIGGIVFGYLYWKKGLGAAIISHIIAHLVMIIFL